MAETIENNFDFESDNYKWLVITVEDNIIKGGIFTDLVQIGRHIGTSESTIKRRLSEMNGTRRIKINGYTITRLPYYKSKRGYNNVRGNK